jgi:uncharacterized protein
MKKTIYITLLVLMPLMAHPLSHNEKSIEAAIHDGRTDIVLTALAQNPFIATMKNNVGYPLFFVAIKSQNVPLVEKFLELGANPNTTLFNGTTALMVASIEGNIDIIKPLLQAGAHINQSDDEGNTALTNAVLFDRNDAIQYLIASGADINHQNKQGSTPLMIAAQEGNLTVVHYLLKNGADRFIKDKKGRTAAAYAKSQVEPTEEASNDPYYMQEIEKYNAIKTLLQ